MRLAQAGAARAEPVEELPDLTAARKIGWLSYQPGWAVNREAQNGVDPSKATRRLAVTTQPGQWVAVSLRHFGRRTLWPHRRLTDLYAGRRHRGR